MIILGANPILSAPADLGIADILKSAKLSIHAGTHLDETAALCTWHLPLAHYLEAWGDTRTYDGTVAITQPLIEPLFGGKTLAEILALLAGTPASSMDIVKATAKSTYLTGFSEWQLETSPLHRHRRGQFHQPVAAAPAANHPIHRSRPSLLQSRPRRFLRTRRHTPAPPTTAALSTTAGSWNCPTR